MSRRHSTTVSQNTPSRPMLDHAWSDMNEETRPDIWKAHGFAARMSDDASRRFRERLGHLTDGNFNRSPGLRGTHRLLGDKSDIRSSRNTGQYMIHTVEFELDQGDTMVFVDLPNMPTDPRKQADCHGIAYRSQQFRVDSEKLLATGSARFAEMLRPTYQFRTQRRRKMANRLPQGVRYVLDLTPPAEGDELVFEMTELSLTPGIMKWWSSYKFHDVDPSLVTGHDDVCTCRRQAPGSLGFDSNEGFNGWQENLGMDPVLELSTGMMESWHETAKCNFTPPTPNRLMQMKADGDYRIYKTPPFRQMPDYCPIRHRNAIIRLMILIQGRDVLLDSASRVWTLVALAKIFDCASVVRDQVMQWIMHGANTRLIEVLPEEAIRIGVALQSPQVTQCAFRILVNEMALQEAATDGARRQAKRVTMFGRRLGECGDELSNLIQHAARALVERVASTKALLNSPDLFDYWNIAEWGKLRRLELLLSRSGEPVCEETLVKLRELMISLHKAVASRLDEAARENLEDKQPMLSSMDTDRATYVLPDDFEKLRDILPGLNLLQKLLCPFIYNDFGERCSWPLYVGLRLQWRLQEGQIRYVSLIDEVEGALQRVARDKPAMLCTDEWAEFFEAGENDGENEGPRVKSNWISLERMDKEVKDALRPLTVSWIRHDVDPPLNITRHMLLTLTINEMKFLPLWAGGFDDGTGGVFESFVPPTDMGPNGPGPAYHTGNTLPSAPPSISESMMEDMSSMWIKGSTTAASMDAHDSISTVYRPDRVVADDSSVVSEEFTANGPEYQEARVAVPVEHQGDDGAAGSTDYLSDMDGDDGQWTMTNSGCIVVDGFELEGHEVDRPHGDMSDSEDSVVVV